MIGRVQGYEDRLRRRDLLIDEQDLSAFYRRRLPGVCEPRSLSALIKTRGGDAFLRMTEADLLRYRPDPADLALYPERMAVGRRDLEVRYRFEPGAEADGATLRVPAALAPEVAPEALEWLVPGLLREKIDILVRGLPKSIRRRLVPLAGVIDTILREMPRSGGLLVSALGEFLHRRFGIDVPAAAWPANDVPDHLRMRVAITAADGREIAAGRDPALLRRSAAPGHIPAEARARWEKAGLTRWDFGELPDAVDSPPGARSAWVAYPALEAGESSVNLKLYPRRNQALAAHRNGVAALCAIHCARDVKFLKRNLALPEEMHPAARYLGGARALEAAMVARVLQDLFAADIRSPQGFEEPRGGRRPTDPAGRPRASLCRDPRARGPCGGPRADRSPRPGGRAALRTSAVPWRKSWRTWSRTTSSRSTTGPAYPISCVTSRRSPSGQAAEPWTSKRTGSRRPGSRRSPGGSTRC